ncbi:unnamed protein product [Candidula unifasciata]|uniref:SWI/SNF-related matrix-associated actin-dependent regulator of chromatin subfamily A-like protein 1 n=1 Tax=Candidula unifasciata TaxID=100452 RepID=A0A8S3ZJP8_9EUPU|nr:unnamed protein product [Candidula unifasciata]
MSMMSGQGLTEEQKQKIQENRLRALARRIEKQSPVKNSSSSQLTSGVVDLHPPNIRSTNFYSEKRDVNKGNSTSNNTGPNNYNSTSSSHGKDTNKVLKKNGVSNLRGKCVYIGKDTFSVEVGYSAPLLQYFKQLTTRQYDASTKVWSFKMEEYNTFIKGVQSFRPDIEIESLPRWIVQNFAFTNKTNVDALPKVDLSRVDEKLVTALLPFQLDGVKCAIQHNGRLLIADEMGLGKTLQAICVACYYRQEWPLLIVSPSSVRFDWAQQICRWLPSVAPCDINVVESSKSSFTSGMINILSYDLLSKKVEELKKQKFKVIIMDESHFLKNAKTVRTKAAVPLLKSAKRVLLLSGTPALSRPSELYSQITAVCPDLFKFHEFGLRYCAAKEMQWGWDYSSSSNMVELQALLEEKIMIRREKKDVLSQLPSKYRQVIMLDPSSVHKHKDLKAASKIMSNVKLKGLNKRGALLEYFHETCRAKLSAVRGYVLDLVESDKKFLVFAHHKEMLDCIEDGIKSEASHIQYIRIDGRTTSEQRHFFCSKFQACDSYKVAILSITAANAGINLSAANIVVFAELFWNPGILVQAEDRAHRIGQKDNVNIQYLVAQHTADDYIWPLVQGKLDTLSKAGLAKDDFADADTTRLKDNTQQTLLDMFSSEFIDDTIPDIQPADIEMPVDISVNSSSMTQLEKTPSKRQISITSFFERTPPKKMRLDEDAVSATQQPEHCERVVKVGKAEDEFMTTQQPDNHASIENKTLDKTGDLNKSRRDPGSVVCTVMPWLDEELTSQDCDGDESVQSSLTGNDESTNKSSQETITGTADSLNAACEESARDDPQDDLTWLEGLNWDDEM